MYGAAGGCAIRFTHYLDFFIIGAPASEECGLAVKSLVKVFGDLGLPIAKSKLEGPTTKLSFLGIKIDTSKMEICLPEEKSSGL